MKKVLPFILFISTIASAQLQRYDNFAATTSSASGIGNLTQVIPNATLTVFNQPAVGVSCAGGGCVAATTFTSRTGGTPCGAAVPLTRPTANVCIGTADSQGNFGFWAAAGAYQYCIAATNFTTTCYNVILGPTLDGTNTFTGQIQCKDLEAVKCVDSANLQGWAGADVGAWLNAAYAALPSTGGQIHLFNLGNTCMSFTTNIAFTTSGKYVKLIGHEATPGGISGGACLNYTPTTGIAMSLDYVPVSVSNYPPQHGLRDIVLINNNCQTSGGCGGSAFGINFGSTNWGASNATFDRVSVIGFAFGYNNGNTNNIPAITWLNPHFQANAIAFVNGGNTNNIFIGGFFVGNASAIQASTTTGGEYEFIGTNFAVNSGPLLDFTRNTSRVYVTCNACHFEDSTSASATSPHFIVGLVNAYISGGIMESDQTSGTQDFFISISTGGVLMIHGMELLSGGKTFTNAFTIATGARADINLNDVSTTQIPIASLLGGAGASAGLVVPMNTAISTPIQLGGTIQNVGGTSTMGLTLKKGSGAGNYTNATTTYAVADSANLCFTVTIPTGWKLAVSASGGLGTATAAVVANVALTDNAACSTANAGILVENQVTAPAAATQEPFSMNWVITGDGASHNVALQFKTSNAADSATLSNSTATLTPTMAFTLMPSN